MADTPNTPNTTKLNFFEPLAVDKKRSFMLYGPPGCGKTYLAGTAVRGTSDRMVVFDFKGGFNTLHDLVESRVAGKPQVMRANTLKQSIVTFEQLCLALAQFERGNAQGAFRWLVVDSMTDCCAMLMRQIRGKIEKETPAPGGKRSKDGMASLNEYGQVNQRMSDVVSRLLNLPVENIIFTAWAKRLDTGWTMPRMETEGISDMVAGACDHVFYLKSIPDPGDPNSMVIDDTKPAAIKHLVICESSEVMARNRGGALPPVCEPNLQVILKLLEDSGL